MFWNKWNTDSISLNSINTSSYHSIYSFYLSPVTLFRFSSKKKLGHRWHPFTKKDTWYQHIWQHVRCGMLISYNPSHPTHINP